jgi:hypothetical protein
MIAILARALLVVALLIWSDIATAQSQPVIHIDSPPNGALISAGKTVSILVSTNDTTITQVGLIVESPLPKILPRRGSGQFAFTMDVPADTAPGAYHISAIGIRDNGVASTPATITLVISAGQAPVSVHISPEQLEFKFPGLQERLELYQDDSTINLSEGPGVTWRSLNEAVATVNAFGIVTAVGPGVTEIEGIYQLASISLTSRISVEVLNPIKGDLNGDGRVDLDDLNFLTDRLDTNIIVKTDARDLNQDGRLNEIDVEILTTLCTYPKCASEGVSIPGDIDRDGDVDQNDLDILRANLSKSVSESQCGARCDVDSDGKITDLDVQKLLPLCTRPNCATR